MLIITLVAPGPLDPRRVAPLVRELGVTHAERLGERAVDLYTDAAPAAARRAAAAIDDVDVIVQPAEHRAKRLLISDMDSTLIGQECIDELAAVHGLKPQVAAITERAMAGELDFAEALRERVALLKGIPQTVVAELLDTVIEPSPGAAELIAACRAHGVRTVLVSGGFTLFAEPVAARLGMDAAYANRLVVEGGVLTGEVVHPVLGADAKRERLEAECASLGIAPSQAIALGDGANDLKMLEAAGLGLAYRAKPKVAELADAAISHTDLTTAIYAMGLYETGYESERPAPKPLAVPKV